MKRFLTTLVNSVFCVMHFLFLVFCWPYLLLCLFTGGLFDWPTVGEIRELTKTDDD